MTALLVSQLTEPLCWFFLVAGAAWLRGWWYRGERKAHLRWMVVALLGLYAYCLPVVAYVTTGLLEWPYPPRETRPDEPAIVVLTGGILRPDRIRKQAELNSSSLQRCLKAAELYRSGPPCLVLITGGKVDPRRRGPTPAVAMRDFLIGQGVPDTDIILEDHSRSTYESAVQSAERLRERQINSVCLVTDASHLHRSVKCFQAQGIQVAPVGCFYRATGIEWNCGYFLPSAEAAYTNNQALHEWIGLLWYKMRGRI